MPWLSPKVIANQGWCAVPGLSWLTHDVKLAQIDPTQQFRRQCSTFHRFMREIYWVSRCRIVLLWCWRFPRRCKILISAPANVFCCCVFLTSCLLSVTFVFGQRVQLYIHKIIRKNKTGKYKHGLVAWLLTFTWIICTLLETGYFSVDKYFLIILVIQFSIAKAFSSWIFDTWFSMCS